MKLMQKIIQSIRKCESIVLQGQEDVDALEEETDKLQKYYKEYVQKHRQMDYKHQKMYEKTVYKVKQKILDQREKLSLIKTNYHNFQAQNRRKNTFSISKKPKVQPKWINNLRGIFGLVGALLLHMLIGAVHRWAMINIYVTSYYRINSDPSLITNHNSIGTPISMFAIGLTMKVSLTLCEKYGRILIMGLAIAGMVLWTLLSSYMPSICLFILFHHFLNGLCAGFLFLVPMKECQQYFRNCNLFINSFVLIGNGLGGSFFGFLNRKCMNPKLLLPNKEGFYEGQLSCIAEQFPKCMQQFSLTLGIIGFIGLLFIWRLCVYNAQQKQVRTVQRLPEIDFSFSCSTEEEALKSLIFWKVFFLIIICSCGNYFTTMNYKNIPSSTIHDSIFLEDVMLAGNVVNGISRAFWGVMFINFGFKYVFAVTMSLNIICFVVIRWAIYNYQMYIFVYSIICAALGGLMVLISNLCLLLFGDFIGNQIFTYFWATFSLSCLLQYILRQLLLSQLQYIKFYNIFLVLAGLGLIFGSVTKYQGSWQNSLANLQF